MAAAMAPEATAAAAEATATAIAAATAAEATAAEAKAATAAKATAEAKAKAVAAPAKETDVAMAAESEEAGEPLDLVTCSHCSFVTSKLVPRCHVSTHADGRQFCDGPWLALCNEAAQSGGRGGRNATKRPRLNQ